MKHWTALVFYKIVILTCSKVSGNQIMTYELTESIALREKIPAFGTSPVVGHVSLASCANFCVQRKPCQMLFYNAETRKCFLYDFLVWDGTSMKASSGYRALKMLNEGNARCRDDDIWNRAGGLCFRQFSSGAMIPSSEAKNRCNSLQSSLLIIDTKQKQTFAEKYYRDTNAVPALVGLSDIVSEGTWIWDNGEPFDSSHWGAEGIDFNRVDITRPNLFCFNADCGWIGVYQNIFMVWDNCCAYTSDWLCAYNP